MRYLLSGIVLSIASLPALGHVNVFLSGDAFFSSQVDHDYYTYDPKAKSLALEYARYTSWSMFCGRVGLEQITVDGVPPEVVASIQRVAGELIAAAPPEQRVSTERGILQDRDEPAEPVAVVPAVVLWVYDRVFDVSQFPIGLKLNETWAEDQGAHGAVYDSFHDDMAVTDWRLSKQVAPLALRTCTRSPDRADRLV